MTMYAGDPAPPRPRNRTGRSAMSKLGELYRELSDDEGDMDTQVPDVPTKLNHDP